MIKMSFSGGRGQRRSSTRDLLHVACLAATALVSAVAGGVSLPGVAGAQERAISLYNIHNGEKITIVFKKDGQYVPKALERLNFFLRDWRSNEPTKIDPRLFDLLAAIHEELGSQRPIHVVSGYRSPKTNAMLRRTRGGQAKRSQHMFGRAIDVHFPDISIRQLRYSAMVRQVGGVGYYPTSALPFVHVDTGRVRHWPRMSRQELALLFPRGRSRHVPSDRRPLQRTDVAWAKQKYPQLASVLGRFHQMRTNGRSLPQPPVPDWSTQTQVAAAVPRPAVPRPATPPHSGLALASTGPSWPRAPRSQPAPRLVAAPKLLAKTAPETRAPSAATSHNKNDGDLARRMLTRLAALASRDQAPATSRPPPKVRYAGLTPPAPQPAAWISAPAFDEEHPEEMSYRPFPIAPYLTLTSSSDDAALVKLAQPDPAQTVASLDNADQLETTRLTRGRAMAAAPRVHRFQGAAIHTVAFIRPGELQRTALAQ